MTQRKKNQAALKIHLFTNVAYCADCGKGMWYRSDRRVTPAVHMVDMEQKSVHLMR